jgi:phosphoglycerate dehydrogenase-like enzyme
VIRVGVERCIDGSFLTQFPAEVEVVRIPDDPSADIALDVWIAAMSSSISRRQWPRLKGVKLVQAVTAGVDGLLEFLPVGPTLCDARGVHDIATAEWAVTAVLAMQKNLPFFVHLQDRADWWAKGEAEAICLMSPETVRNEEAPALIQEIAGARILIVGYGAIGQAIEARLAPFGPSFLRVARTVRAGVFPVCSLDGLLPLADIIVVITPLTSETRHLIDARRLSLIRPGALLVNAGRGAVVDTDALLEALNARKIRAAIDVVDPEPLPLQHPLWKAPNLLITPHIATDTSLYVKRAFVFVSQQLHRYVRGEEVLNVVSGEY